VTTTSLSATLDAVARLRAEIDRERAHLARLAPARQRLRIQAWMCRARAEQERHPTSRDLIRAVAAIAKDLGTLCRLYWPGSVRVLQSGVSPSMVAPGASTWADAAAHATALDRPDPSPKLDADGWADADKLLPQPAKPELVLRDVVGVLEQLTGPLDAQYPRAPARDAGAMPELVRAAAKLRWLRGTKRDVGSWALAMGRMRWLAAESGQANLQITLDPLFVPGSPWAHEIARRKA
jgi:hypothetical protein